jgi:hypothetical protein
MQRHLAPSLLPRTLPIACAALMLFACTTPPDRDLGVFVMTPQLKPIKLVGWDYQPNKLVRTVNALRALGKDEALSLLRSYFAADPFDLSRDEDVQIICRFLFVNPDGWKRPTLGAPVPEARPEEEDHFPQFPIVLSDGIPFLLATGYRVGGGGPKSWALLIECQQLQLTDKDMRIADRDQAKVAAESLVASDGFKRLYRDDEQTAMARSIVLAQAKLVQQ